MRKYLSVFMLFARSTIDRLLLLLAAMAAIEGTLFWRAMQNNAALEQTFVLSRIPWVCAVFFLIFTAVLALSGCEHGAKTGYTLRRLQIGEKSVFFCQAAYNTACYFIFSAVQIIVILGLFRCYTLAADAFHVSPQSVFLAIYRNSFLHSLLPLEEISRYVRNGILIVCLGITAAYYPMRQRAGKTAIALIALVCVLLPFFSSGMGSFTGDVVLSAAAILVVIKVLSSVFEKEAQYEA